MPIGAGCQEAAMIHKRGKRWRVIVYAGRDPITGRKRQKSVTVTARAEAKQAEARLITEVGAGQHRASSNRTVAELVDRWLEWRQSARPISPTTVATYRGYVERNIRPVLGKLQVRQLDTATLDAFYAHLRKQGGKGGRPMAASSVHQVHAILSGALNRAVVWGWIPSNPARLASPPSIERADVQPPAVEDGPRLLKVAVAEDRELGLFLRLAAVLGIRRGELCAVRWSDVDLDRGEVLIASGIVRVPGESLLDKPTKTHAKRRVLSAPERSNCSAPIGSLRPRMRSPAGPRWPRTPACSRAPLTGRPRSTRTVSPTASVASRDDSACNVGFMTCGTSWSRSWWPVGWTGARSRAGLGTRTAT
jgi:integrase